MTELAVSVRLKADGSGLVGELRVSKAELDKLAQAAKGAGSSAAKAGGDIERAGEKTRKAGQAARQASSGFGELRTVIASLGLIALGRQVVNNALSFERLERTLTFVTGSHAAARQEIEFLRAESERLGLSFKDLAPEYAKIAAAAKGTSLQGRATRDIFIGVASAAATLGLTGDQVAGTLNALQQIISKGTVQAEELRGQLGDRLVGAFQIAARATGKSTKELSKLLEVGGLTADDFIPRFAKALKDDFGGAAEAAADSTQGALNRMSNAWYDLEVTFAQSGFLQGLAEGAKSATAELNTLRGDNGLAGLGKSLGEAIAFLGRNIDLITSLTAGWLSARAALAVLTPAVALLSGTLAVTPLGLAATAIGAVVGGLMLWKTRSTELQNVEKDRPKNLNKITELTRDAAAASGDRATQLLKERDALVELAIAELEAKKAQLESERDKLGRVKKGGIITPRTAEKLGIPQDYGMSPEEKLKALDLDTQISFYDHQISNLRQSLNNVVQGVKETGGGLGGLGLTEEEKNKIRADYYDAASALDPLIAREQQLKEITKRLNDALKVGVDPAAIERLKKLAEEKFAAPDAAKWMDEQAKASREQLRLLGLSTREREIEEETIRRVNDAKKDGITIEGENLEIVRQQVAAEYDVAEAAEKRREAQKRAADEFNKIWENAVENVQRTLADKIDDALKGKISSVKDFFKSFVAIGRRAIADTLAALVFTGGKIPEGSSLSGLAGVLTSIFGGKKKKEKEGEDKRAWVKKIEDDLDIAPKDKPKLGAFGVGLKDAFTQAEELLKPLAEGLKKTFKPLFESFGKTFKGVFGRSVGEAFGRAFGGAGVGTMVAGIGKALGINLNNTGAQVGGAIGSFIPVPGGNIIGSIIGGLVGKLFGGKTPVARASFSTGAVDPETYKRGKADTGVAVGLVGAARQGLEQIASTLGGSIVEGLDLGGLGTRKKKYVFDPVGQGKKFGKSKSTRYNTAEEATAAAVQYALEHDAIAGLSETASRVLKQFKDVNVGLREATKVVNLERFIDSFTNPFKTAAKEFELQAAERVKVARNYGFDVLEIERLNAKEREKFIAATLEQTTGGVKRLLDDLKLGGRAEGSAVERRAALLAERDQLAAQAQAGDTSALDRLAEISAQLLDASEEAFGSTQAYADDRAATMSLLQSLLTETEARIKAAQDEAKASVAAATNPQLSEANQSLDDIANGVGQLLAEFVRLRQAMTGTTSQGTATPTPAVNADLLARLRASVMRF